MKKFFSLLRSCFAIKDRKYYYRNQCLTDDLERELLKAYARRG